VALARAAAIAAAGALAGGLLAGSPAHASAVRGRHAARSAGSALARAQAELARFERAAPRGVSLSETGSTLFYPLFSAWAQAYRAARLETAATGSGAGQSDALKGTVDIGASDAYLPPSDPPTLLNIPVVVSAQQIDYNLPGLGGRTHLRLDAAVLNGMYTGSITYWDDSAIARLNRGVRLPHIPVIPLHRSDGSGDTFMFTSYLDFQDPQSFVAALGGPNTSVAFPRTPNALAENGNSGMLATCEATRGCVAYIGVSYLRSALAHGLGVAALLNGRGSFVLPTPRNISNEVASYPKIPANGTISLIDSRSRRARYGYPIVNFEYAIVNAVQPSPQRAAAIRALLAWGMDERRGAAPRFLDPIYFQPLPLNALEVAIGLLQRIGR